MHDAFHLLRLIFAWDPLSCEDREASQQFKFKIYVSAGNRTSDPSLINRTH